MDQKGHIIDQKGLKMYENKQKREFSTKKKLFFSEIFLSRIGGYPPTMGEQWLLKQFCLNHPVEHIQKPKLPKLYVRVETSTSYFIIHNQFVK